VSTPFWPDQRPDPRPWPHHHPQPDDPGFDAWYDSLDDETRAIIEAPPKANRRDTETGPEPAF